MWNWFLTILGIASDEAISQPIEKNKLHLNESFKDTEKLKRRETINKQNKFRSLTGQREGFFFRKDNSCSNMGEPSIESQGFAANVKTQNKANPNFRKSDSCIKSSNHMNFLIKPEFKFPSQVVNRVNSETIKLVDVDCQKNYTSQENGKTALQHEHDKVETHVPPKNEPNKNIMEDVMENIKEDVMENIKEDVKENIKEDLKEDIQEDVKEDIQEDVKEDIKEDMKEDIKEDVKEDIKEDVKEDIKEDVKEDIKEDVKEDIKEDVKEDIKEDVKEDIKEDVKEDIKEDVKEDIKEDSKEDIGEAIHGDIKENVLKDIKNDIKDFEKNSNEDLKKVVIENVKEEFKEDRKDSVKLETQASKNFLVNGRESFLKETGNLNMKKQNGDSGVTKKKSGVKEKNAVDSIGNTSKAFSPKHSKVKAKKRE